MKGYFKFLFNDFKSTFKECTFLEKFLLIGYSILIPFLVVLTSVEMVDAIINGPIWSAIFLSFFNIVLWIGISTLIAITIWAYIEFGDDI